MRERRGHRRCRRGLHGGAAELAVFDLQELKFDPVIGPQELREFSKAQTPDGISLDNLDPLAVRMAQRINQSDELVLLFPIWWELMPAQMKGFIDKVVFPGLFYKYLGKYKMRKLSDRLDTVTLITTMNTPSLIYSLFYGSCIKFALKHGTFRKLGVKNVRWINLSAVKFKSQKGREKYLRRIDAMYRAPAGAYMVASKVCAQSVVGRARGDFWRPSASKFCGASQASNAALRAGQSVSVIANQAVSRFSPFTTMCWRKVPS